MRRTPWSVLAAWIGTAVLPSSGHAQSTSYLSSLATPPRFVGTCGVGPAPVQLRADAPVRGLESRQLALTAEGSSARRTLMVYTDRRGGLRQYAEMSGPVAGEKSRESAEVEATVDSTGRVRGFLLHHTTPDRGAVRHTRRALTSAERRKVRVLAGWLLERCRA